MDSNSLYYGDNLDILRRYVSDESVDLMYLDPPFNSNQSQQRRGYCSDPFCGCGTTIAAAEKLGRRWIGIGIGIDLTHIAIGDDGTIARDVVVALGGRRNGIGGADA